MQRQACQRCEVSFACRCNPAPLDPMRFFMNKRFAQIRGAAHKARSYVSTKSLAAGAALAGPAMAFAQAVDPFTTATTSIKEKVAAYGAELVVVAAVGVVFMVAIKYVKKIPRAA